MRFRRALHTPSHPFLHPARTLVESQGFSERSLAFRRSRIRVTNNASFAVMETTGRVTGGATNATGDVVKGNVALVNFG